VTENRSPTADELNGFKQDTVHWPAKAYRVTNIDSDGNEITSSNPLPVSMPLSETYDVLIATDSTDSNITYIGKAAKGALTSASVWQIKIIDKTSGVSISFKGDVDTFTHEWDERES
jgi:hypothetical protein